jgi:hypothetical protein
MSDGRAKKAVAGAAQQLRPGDLQLRPADASRTVTDRTLRVEELRAGRASPLSGRSSNRTLGSFCQLRMNWTSALMSSGFNGPPLFLAQADIVLSRRPLAIAARR